MNCATWKVRGVSAPPRAKVVGRWLKEHDVGLVGLLETRVKAIHIDRAAGNIDRSWNWIHNGQFHNRMRILVGWIPDLVNVQVAVVHLQLNHCRVTIKSTNVSFWFTILYRLNQSLFDHSLFYVPVLSKIEVGVGLFGSLTI